MMGFINRSLTQSFEPATTPSPGVTSNSVNHGSLKSTVLGLGIVIILLTVFFVVVRLYSNYHAARGLGWDDCRLLKLIGFEKLQVLTSARVLRRCNSFTSIIYWSWLFP